MTMPNQQPGLGEIAKQLLGLPSPEKVITELQRLNNNFETMQPDIHRLAKAMEGISGADIRNLTAALSGVNAGDLIRLINEFNHTASQICERLWGKK